MPTDTSVCYVADNNFLYPTLFSIHSLRQFINSQDLSIFVFTIDCDAAALAAFRNYELQFGFSTVPLDLKNVLHVDRDKWNPTHVPPSTIGRFYIESLLPAQVNRIFYVDGDTMFVASPAALLDFNPGKGTLAATDDASFFSISDIGAFGSNIRIYYNSIGLEKSRGYLNAGVMFAERKAWADIMRDAEIYFRENTSRCRHHDQSAINAVIGDRRIRLSLGWNFQTPFRYWGIENIAHPKILHFTQFPKPWMCECEPWSDVSRSFATIGAEMELSTLPINRIPEDQRLIYDQLAKKQQRRLKGLLRFRLERRRREARRLLASAAI